MSTLVDNEASPIALGLWPIAGITTVGVTADDARSTIATAIECGITMFDTAYSYGYDGESDRYLGEFLRYDRPRFRVIGKVGQRWNSQRKRVIDGTAQGIINDAETSLKRLGIEYFDILMLHAPDPAVPIEISATALWELQHRDLCRAIGVSNVGISELDAFVAAAACDAIECPLNLLQRQSLDSLVPAATRHGCDVYVFWTLMKGLLAGRIARDHEFAAGDSRPGYEIFQGQARAHAHDVLDAMAVIARESSLTIAQLSIGWVLSQVGVTGALVGARRPDQVREIATTRPLADEIVALIDEAVAGCV